MSSTAVEVSSTAAEMSDAALDYLAREVKRGQCILFLGSGVHAPSPPGGPNYFDAERPLMASELSQELADLEKFKARFPKESEYHLPRVAQHYEVKRGRWNLIDNVKMAVLEQKKPSKILHELAGLDFPLVMTTNYDCLFELALQAIGKDPILSVYDPSGKDETLDVVKLDPGRPFISKIHGDIRQPESLVITDEDYIQFVLRMSSKEPYDPVPMTFKFYLRRWPTLFLGYSLTDYNLRLLFKTLRWHVDKARLPEMYSVDRYPDPLVVDVWSAQNRLINFIVQDVWTFVPQLYQKVKGVNDAA